MKFRNVETDVKNRLANEAIVKIKELIACTRKDAKESDSEYSEWNKSRNLLLNGRDESELNEEDSMLLRIANHNINQLDVQKDNIQKALVKLEDLLRRSNISKNHFEMHDDTAHLLSQMSEELTPLKDPQAEIQKIRKIVFGLEGYREVLALR